MMATATPVCVLRPDADLELCVFFHRPSGSFTYLLIDLPSSECAIIDPVLDFDASTGLTGSGALEALVEQIHRRQARLRWILETHVHADHLSGARELRRRLGGRCVIGQGVSAARASWVAADAIAPDAEFDHYASEGDAFMLGGVALRAMHTPGHTPFCVSYRLDLAGRSLVFVGDTLLPPAIGTARCDFPGGSADALFTSIHRLLSLAPATEIYVCHDYPAPGQLPVPAYTVGQHLATNVHWHDRPDRPTFMRRRAARDAGLALPALFDPSVRFNFGGPVRAPA